MPDDVQIEIRSNTEKLSALAVHDTLVNFVGHELSMGEIVLKSLVPKGDSLSLTRAVGHKGPYDEGLIISGAVGIPEIHKADQLDPESGKFPIFVDRGTGIFGDTDSPIFPKSKEFMKLPPKGDFPIFRKSIKGQEGKEFMASTFAIMISLLRINGETFKAELTEKLQSDKLT